MEHMISALVEKRLIMLCLVIFIKIPKNEVGRLIEFTKFPHLLLFVFHQTSMISMKLRLCNNEQCSQNYYIEPTSKMAAHDSVQLIYVLVLVGNVSQVGEMYITILVTIRGSVFKVVPLLSCRFFCNMILSLTDSLVHGS